MGEEALTDTMRGKIDGLPGFVRRQSTIRDVVPILNKVATYVVETVRIDESDGRRARSQWHGFIDAILPDGTTRLYLAPEVMEALYRHHEGIVKKLRSDRAKASAETRKANGVLPFVRREEGVAS